MIAPKTEAALVRDFRNRHQSRRFSWCGRLYKLAPAGCERTVPESARSFPRGSVEVQVSDSDLNGGRAVAAIADSARFCSLVFKGALRRALPYAVVITLLLAPMLPTANATGDRACCDTSTGTCFDDDNGSGSGSAYLFNTTTGQQLAKLLPDAGRWCRCPITWNGTT